MLVEATIICDGIKGADWLPLASGTLGVTRAGTSGCGQSQFRITRSELVASGQALGPELLVVPGTGVVVGSATPPARSQEHALTRDDPRAFGRDGGEALVTFSPVKCAHAAAANDVESLRLGPLATAGNTVTAALLLGALRCVVHFAAVSVGIGVHKRARGWVAVTANTTIAHPGGIAFLGRLPWGVARLARAGWDGRGRGCGRNDATFALANAARDFACESQCGVTASEVALLVRQALVEGTASFAEGTAISIGVCTRRARAIRQAANIT